MHVPGPPTEAILSHGMHVLVIGGTRYMGYLLVWRLLARGDRVTLLNRGRTPDDFSDRVVRLRGDRRTDFARLVAGRKFDAVVDFAAYEGAEVEEVVRSLETDHYVFISTGQVYLVREGCPKPSREADYEGPLMPRPASEDDQGQWDYGAGKRACEDVLAAAKGFPATRVRIPIVNGERDDSRRLESYLWRVVDGGPVILPDGGGHQVRHVYSGDVVKALAGLLGDAKTFGQAYNLANEETPTLGELVAMMARELGAPVRTASVPVKKIVDAGLVVREVSPFSSRWQSFLDPERAKKELGFRATPVSEQVRGIVATWLARRPEEPPKGYEKRKRELELT
jgi:nucleoside-diphosphate-sugar epimerase